ncbi:MAG: DUF1501 domain-containing protein [Planctomycetota bacterium]
MPPRQMKPTHPLPRRAALQVGAASITGLGLNHLTALRQLAADEGNVVPGRPKAVIYIFLSGGLAQHDSFDPKPEAPADIRGEFAPIATRTPGVHICEHLPLLANCSDRWAMVRSLTHPYNEHSIGHHVMLTGRTPTPVGFNPNRPTAHDHPSFAALATRLLPPRNNLPPAAVLPEKLVHVTGRTIPGQFAGELGPRFEPWFVEASQYRDTDYVHGAFPQYGFQRQRGRQTPAGYRYEAPRLELAGNLLRDQFSSRLALLRSIEAQRTSLDTAAEQLRYDRHREAAVSLLLDSHVHRALDVHAASDRLQDRYGRNSFGWSLLMARQLVEAGVSLVQVNLGNDESWDTHEAAFRNLREFLLPPTDRAVSALLEDLSERGLLDDVLVVMAGEFGRTPKVFTFPGAETRLPGRDHWGAVQTVFFAGAGIRGGSVVGESDATGGYPKADPQTPENMAATIYQALGLPRSIAWKDTFERPHHVYHGEPIAGLM